MKSALLGGEMGDWLGKRRRLEANTAFRTFAVYATADFGVIASRTAHRTRLRDPSGSHRADLRPVTGAPAARGRAGRDRRHHADRAGR